MEWTCAACAGTNPSGTRYCGHCGQPLRTDPESATLSTAEISETVAEVAALLDAPGSSPEERRLVTVLFADIAGFTALADRLDPERLVEVIDPVLAAMSNVITSYGGRVSKYAGDALLAFFGAPQAHEDDAVRALLAAREMQLEVGRLTSALLDETGPLTLHIGVNTGHVVTGFRGGEVGLDYSVLGDAVNVAQRLEAASAGGEVYVGELTHELSRDSFRFEEVGALILKGKSKPVRTWRLAAEAEAEARRAAGMIVGRERECAVLTKLVAAVAAGEPGFVALIGEPGVGKSRLLQALREDAEDAGLRWSQLRCRSYGSGAYGPYLELIRELADVHPDDPADMAAARVAETAGNVGAGAAVPYLLHVLGLGDGGAIPGGVLASPATLRHHVHEAMIGFLTARAALSPLAIAIEDVHWMDTASVELTTLLAERSSGLPLCAAVTARPEGRDVVKRLETAFGRTVEVLELARLDRGAIATLLEDILGIPDEPLLDLVESRTSGNPLFVQEVVRTLLDADALVQRGSSWHVDAREAAERVPTTVESVLAARIDLLPGEAAELLQVASVIGQEVRPSLLREVAGIDAPAIAGLIDVLIEREFLDRVEGVTTETHLLFHHALVADVAYGRLLRRQRREIHRQVLESAIRLYGSGDDVIDLVAYHAYHGDMGAGALPYLERAGRRAAQLFANEEAVVHLRRAIGIAETLQSPDDTLAPLILELARVEEVTGAYESALALYERAQALTNELSPYLGAASTWRKLGRYEDSQRVLDAGREAHPEPSPAETAALALEQGWVLGSRGDSGGAAAVLEAGVAAAGPDDQLAGRLLVALARTLESLGREEEALAHCLDATRRFEAAGNLPQLVVALRVLGGLESEVAGEDRGGQERARKTLERAFEIARQVGNAEEQGAALINLSQILSTLSEAEAALDANREALVAFESVGLKGGVACAYCNLSERLQDLDRWEEALEASRQGLAIAEEIGNPFWTTGALIGIATVQNQLGNSREAAAAAEDALERALAHGITGRATFAFEQAIHAHEALGDRDRAEELRSRSNVLVRQ